MRGEEKERETKGQGQVKVGMNCFATEAAVGHTAIDCIKGYTGVVPAGAA